MTGGSHELMILGLQAATWTQRRHVWPIGSFRVSASFRSNLKRELNVYCIDSFRKSETWSRAHFDSQMRNAYCIGQRNEDLKCVHTLGVVHFESIVSVVFYYWFWLSTVFLVEVEEAATKSDSKGFSTICVYGVKREHRIGVWYTGCRSEQRTNLIDRLTDWIPGLHLWMLTYNATRG